MAVSCYDARTAPPAGLEKRLRQLAPRKKRKRGLDGEVLDGYLLSGANQEHGILSREGAPDMDIAERFPVGTRLRILPNHACATGAQFPAYHALAPDGTAAEWPRLHGW